MLGHLKESLEEAARTAASALAAAAALFVVLCFVCAAIFVHVLDGYGAVAACLTMAVIFLVLALASGGIYLSRARRRRLRERQRDSEPSPLSSMLSNPMMLGLGLQAVRSIGVLRLIPLLAIGGLAIGLIAGRQSSKTAEPAE